MHSAALFYRVGSAVRLVYRPDEVPVPRVLSTHSDADRRHAVSEACTVLRAGGLVAIPTETVYGLAADASSEAAVQRIFAAKQRPHGHPLILHVASVEAARACAGHWDPLAQKLAAAHWPGPLTLVVPRAAHVLDAVTGGAESVALRVPAHPLTLELLRALGRPLAAPSANHHQHVSPTRAEHVLASLGERVDLVLDGGPTSQGIESTIVHVAQRRVLRPGPLGVTELRRLVPELSFEEGQTASTTVHDAPGMSARHYAPRTPLLLADRATMQKLVQERGAVWLARGHALDVGRGLVLTDEPSDYARALFAAIHSLDAQGAAVIAVEAPPAGQAWAAVRDRLRRAAIDRA